MEISRCFIVVRYLFVEAFHQPSVCTTPTVIPRKRKG